MFHFGNFKDWAPLPFGLRVGCLLIKAGIDATPEIYSKQARAAGVAIDLSNRRWLSIFIPPVQTFDKVCAAAGLPLPGSALHRKYWDRPGDGFLRHAVLCGLHRAKDPDFAAKEMIAFFAACREPVTLDQYRQLLVTCEKLRT